MFRQIFNPDLFHGKSRKSKFFEGWYFKLVDNQKEAVVALIPGIYKSSMSSHSHSFIQILIGKEAKYHYIKFPSTSFTSMENSFHIFIDNNEFSLHHINIDINTKDVSIKGTLTFKNLYKWPDSLLNPGSMGFYNYFSFMECYSQVCVVEGFINGSLQINGKTIDFTKGNLYIEKNWGKAFPYSWIWIQCNSFLNGKASLTCSIGHVPFLFTSFRGFLVGLYYNNRFIKFTSINRSNLSIEQIDSDVVIKLKRLNYELIIKTYSEKNKFILCNGPSSQGMIPLVNENLLGKVDVKLTDLREKTVLFQDTGFCSGIEYGGEMMKIIKNKV